MKGCELCSNPARMYCESDQASLCWSCDEKVHGANFLVAKHMRCLLCHACQCLTPWKASEEEEEASSSRYSGRKRNRENSDLDYGVRRFSREKERETD
ncbi:B-box-type zinc finger [Dillenia turbinata]|uniref:B-box-type zinc finger n=1 Tax=Dillenia turbinata TaxID=194707 RepID=A0AAN8WDJ5_9MAGN